MDKPGRIPPCCAAEMGGGRWSVGAGGKHRTFVDPELGVMTSVFIVVRFLGRDGQCGKGERALDSGKGVRVGEE